MIKLKLIQNLDNTHQKGENEKAFSAFNPPPQKKSNLKLFELCDVLSKQCSNKRSEECQENVPLIITPSPPA